MRPAAPWWNTPRNATPCAVLFFHIGKTGGGSIVTWLMRQNPRFTLKLDYGRSRLFCVLHADLFTDVNARWQLNGGVYAGEQPRWEQTSVAVQYHDRSHGAFWNHIAPKLPELRQRYARAGGKLLVMTTIRDPASMIVSWYRQWPPRLPNRTIAHFRDWVSNASGLMMRACREGLELETRMQPAGSSPPSISLTPHRLSPSRGRRADLRAKLWAVKDLAHDTRAAIRLPGPTLDLGHVAPRLNVRPDWRRGGRRLDATHTRPFLPPLARIRATVSDAAHSIPWRAPQHDPARDERGCAECAWAWYDTMPARERGAMRQAAV